MRDRWTRLRVGYRRGFPEVAGVANGWWGLVVEEWRRPSGVQGGLAQNVREVPCTRGVRVACDAVGAQSGTGPLYTWGCAGVTIGCVEIECLSRPFQESHAMRNDADHVPTSKFPIPPEVARAAKEQEAAALERSKKAITNLGAARLAAKLIRAARLTALVSAEALRVDPMNPGTKKLAEALTSDAPEHGTHPVSNPAPAGRDAMPAVNQRSEENAGTPRVEEAKKVPGRATPITIIEVKGGAGRRDDVTKNGSMAKRGPEEVDAPIVVRPLSALRASASMPASRGPTRR